MSSGRERERILVSGLAHPELLSSNKMTSISSFKIKLAQALPVLSGQETELRPAAEDGSEFHFRHWNVTPPKCQPVPPAEEAQQSP